MNEREAQNAIQQMINFIEKEAEDRAMDIRKKTEEECTIEKGNMISEARRKMKAEFEKKLADYAVQKKIDRSAALNKTKIKKMAERNKLMESIQAEAADKLVAMLTSDKAKYRALMKNLILQGLLKLMEVDVVIQCRKSDAELVKELIEETGTEYVTRLKNEVPKLKGRDIKYRLVVDEKSYLPEHNTRESGLPSCLGGVQLRAQRDRIVCNNTLDARLELCYQDALPEIRSILFPN